MPNADGGARNAMSVSGFKNSDKEIQVLVLVNDNREVRIDVLFLNDGKAETIVKGIVESLKEYGIMKSIKMIVSDTTSVNVGWKNGIVTRLQSRLRNETNEVPQFIGCQHHILDRALRIIMDEYFGNLLTKDYDKLKHDFEQGEFELEAPSDWRDDMRFSHHLIDVLEMKCVCDIICGKWGTYWFSDQKHNETSFEELSIAFANYPKALSTLTKYWSRDKSSMDIERIDVPKEQCIKQKFFAT
ncbi:hypothetical protein GJ496_000716 [Pomphorhynchus laevis]|nr:hypothetical protein GJ496_000716 [Pomphorhynchus laevis]